MIIRITLTALLVSFVGATSAHAGKALSSGPVAADPGDALLCVTMNVGSKDVSDVAVSIFKGETPGAETGTTCATEAPNGVCGLQTAAVGVGFRFCSVTLKGSTKSMRGKLCNLTTDECSEMR